MQGDTPINAESAEHAESLGFSASSASSASIVVVASFRYGNASFGSGHHRRLK